MAKSDTADYLTTGKRGKGIGIQIPVLHPAFCACEHCRTKRPAATIARDDYVVRVRRQSPYPQSRRESMAYAENLKKDLERQLKEAVAEARARNRALGGGVTFKQIADEYVAHLKKAGKRADRDRYTVALLIEAFGADRDPTTISKADYRHYCETLEAEGLAPATILRRTNSLLAVVNRAKKRDTIVSHQLVGIEKPTVKKSTKPVIFSKTQIAVLLGTAMERYEAEQREAHAAYEPATQRRPPSVVPLRGFCLVALATLMRPSNNFALAWEQLQIDPKKDVGSFRLDEHKNVAKGIEVEGALHPDLVRYLKRIMPAGRPHGLVHPSPAGVPYRNVRQQWRRLIAIANEELPFDEQLTKTRRNFYTWRHAGASYLAESGADPVMIARLMGDTSLRTVLTHYFDSSLGHMAERMAQWHLPTAAGGDAADRPARLH